MLIYVNITDRQTHQKYSSVQYRTSQKFTYAIKRY